MSYGIGPDKSPEWELRDLHDGRLGIFHYGLCRGIVYSQEEAKTWFALRHPEESGGLSITDAVKRI